MLQLPDLKKKKITSYFSDSFSFYKTLSAYWPGIAIATLIAITSLFLSEHYGGPAFLFALLIGMSVNFVRENDTFKKGIDFTAKTVLRIGVALLGLRIGIEEIASLGQPSIIVIAAAVFLTILVALLLSKLLSLSSQLGLLIGASTAICGASAALATACCLPKSPQKERDTIFTIVIVTALSTLAMAFYPILSHHLNLTDLAAGFFIGATIHDVAQVVGAGYSISDKAGNIAVLTKLLRVASLLPIIVLISLFFTSQAKNKTQIRITELLPVFLIFFAILAMLNSVGMIPEIIKSPTDHLSRFLLIMAVSAIGTKTYLGDLVEIGWKPLLLAITTTLFLAFFIIGSMSVLTF